MAQQQFSRPQKKRDDDSYSEDEGWSPSTPASQRRAQEVSSGAQQTLDNIDDVLNQNSSSVSGADKTDPLKNINDVSNLEQSGKWKTNVSSGSSGQPKGQKVSWWRKKSASISITAVLGIGGFLGVGLLSPSLLVVHFSQILTEQFNDQLAAMDFRSTAVLKKKLNLTTTRGFCGAKITIKCKYRTFGTRQLKRLEAAGITPVGDRTIVGRFKPTHFEFEGRRISAGELLNETRKSPSLRNALRHGYNPKFAAASDAISAKVRGVLGLTKASEIKSSADRQKMKDDLKRIASGEPEGIEGGRLRAQTDEDGKVTYTDSQGREYSREEGRRINTLLDEIEARGSLEEAASKTVMKLSLKGALTSTALGLGAADSMCTVWRLVRIAGFAAKIYGQRQLIRYAFEFKKFGSKVRAAAVSETADQPTPEEAALFGDILTSVNTEGKSATDSDGYRFAAYGDIFKPASFDTALASANSGEEKAEEAVNKIEIDDETSRYINGQLLPQNAMTSILRMIDSGPSGGVEAADETCNFVKSWQGQTIVIGAAVAGLFVAVASGGTSVGIGTAAQVAASVAASVAVAILTPKLIEMAKGELITGEENGNEAGNAIVSGAGGLNAVSSQNRGLGVLNQDDVVAYQNTTSSVAADYAEEERAISSAFDPYNRHTFMGSIVSSLLPHVGSTQNTASTLPSILSLLSSTLRPAAEPVSAAESTREMYTQCNDPEYKDKNLAADPFCNLRYGIDPDYLGTDPDAVVDFMLQGNYIASDEDPTPQGDYADYVAKCFLRQSSIGDTFSGYEDGKDGGTADDGTQCIQGEGGSDEERNMMFRLFFLDTSVQEGMDSDFEVGNGDANTVNSGSGSTFTVATFNVLGASHDGERKSDGIVPPWPGRIQKSIDAIRGVDIIGFQEFEPGQRRAVQNALPNYEISTHGKDSDSIMWNGDKFKKIGQGTWKTIYFNPQDIDEPWVKLQDLDTNQEFYVLNAHDPINKGRGSPAARAENGRRHRALVERLSQEAPVILTGDFNSGYEKTAGANASSHEKTQYCILTKGGLMHDAFDLSVNRPARCPNPLPNGANIGNGIDHIFVTAGITLDGNNGFRVKQSGYNGAGGNGSDHRTIIASIEIPGSEDSAASGNLHWPVDRRWYGRYPEDFLGSHHADSGTFTSGVDSLAVDISSPPEGTPVYAMLGGSVSKSSLRGHGLAIKSRVQGGTLEIAYAHGPRTNNKTTYAAGDKIMSIGCLGTCTGSHLHIDMALNGRGVCPQLVFRAMAQNDEINWAALANRSEAPC